MFCTIKVAAWLCTKVQPLLCLFVSRRFLLPAVCIFVLWRVRRLVTCTKESHDALGLKETPSSAAVCSVLLLQPVAQRISPTQWIMYVSSQVNRSQKCILLIVQYKYIKSCSGDFYSPESDPPHKIMRYWVYYSTQLCSWFPTNRICHLEMICIGGVPLLKRHFSGACP